MLDFRRKLQKLFQDPYASLNPRKLLMHIIAVRIAIHHLAMHRADRAHLLVPLLEAVGLNADHATRTPQAFSGGQRHAIGIARALAVQPCFIIAEAPISALDVSIQAQVVNLLMHIQDRLRQPYLFIAQALSMVCYISARIAVMHTGRLVELASAVLLTTHPLHPTTCSLLSAIPVPDPDIERQRASNS